jgi:putative transposase
MYPFIFMDAFHYKVKENHQYQTKAAYVVLGIDMDGRKDTLGVWIGEHESSKFWLSVLNDLKSRGVLDVYLFCVDGLKGFQDAISAVYPQAQIQRCIIHQIRSSTRYVSYKDIQIADEGSEVGLPSCDRRGILGESQSFQRKMGVNLILPV